MRIVRVTPPLLAAAVSVVFLPHARPALADALATPLASTLASPLAFTLAAPLPADAPPPASDKPAFKPEELEQMLAPIALYPDSLLTQVLMASTYPIEVVEADRWAKAHPDLKGDALAKELEKQSWDPSVRSLVNFPQVLSMMSENLSTTVKIGDAFIGQQAEVMATVQTLRSKAAAQGNLKSGPEQTVTTQTTGGTQVIVVESKSPDVIYVPQYNPVVVYGTWPYPAYPPYPYYPPGYVASNVISFGVGVACGVAWGYAWGHCNWGHSNVDININQNINRNTNINRANFERNVQGGQGGRGTWQHDPAHRQGAAYRNTESAQRVGAGTANNRAAEARSDFRGKADAGRSDLNRGAADSFKGNNPGARPTPSAGNRATEGGGAGSRDRPATTGGKASAFEGSNRGGQSTREASNRGASSRTASPSRSAAPARSSGGGAARSGGGARGGGGGRR